MNLIEKPAYTVRLETKPEWKVKVDNSQVPQESTLNLPKLEELIFNYRLGSL